MSTADKPKPEKSVALPDISSKLLTLDPSAGTIIIEEGNITKSKLLPALGVSTFAPLSVARDLIR